MRVLVSGAAAFWAHISVVLCCRQASIAVAGWRSSQPFTSNALSGPSPALQPEASRRL